MKTIKEHIFNIIIVILCIVLVITTFVTMNDFINRMNVYYYDEKDFLYCIQREDYYEMVEYMYRNEANDERVTKGMEECYAVARYYEAASMYKAYKAVGKNAEAKEQEAIMEEQIAMMGELSYVAEDIEKQLGIKVAE